MGGGFLIALKDTFDILITGATGCGKSSTINAIFGEEKAKAGIGVDPETTDITKYDLNNLILWDTPGLGDGKEADERHAKNIIKKLTEKDADGNLLIDLVLVILDGGSRDLGTSYELINNVIIPNLGDNKERRILVAINQADMAMKGKHWDYDKNEPDPKLIEFLDDKVESVRKRIKEATNVNVKPIYYSAGYKEDDDDMQKPYNLSKLLYYIIKSTPREKRMSYANNINNDAEVWKKDDGLKDYKKGILEEIIDSACEGAEMGENIGAIFGEPGRTVGRAVGGVVGGVIGFFKNIFPF